MQSSKITVANSETRQTPIGYSPRPTISPRPLSSSAAQSLSPLICPGDSVEKAGAVADYMHERPNRM